VRFIALSVLLLLVACDKPAARDAGGGAAQPAVQTGAGASSPPSASGPKEGREQPEAEQSDPSKASATRAKQLEQVKLAPRSCVRADELVLHTNAARVLLPTQDSTLEALVVDKEQKLLEWWSGRLGESAQRTATLELASPASRISLVRRAAGLYVIAWVDGQGAVHRVQYETRKFGAVRVVAQGADRRFAPALFERASYSLLAYTASVDEVMHTFVQRAAEPVSDVTPLGHGAAAPTFVLGKDTPSLVMIDARAGISPLLEVEFSAEGKPRPAEVRTPVSQPYAPPLLRALLVPEGEIEVAFSAVGKLAASAIGRVPLRRAVSALPLHASRGYGELAFDAALSGHAALFAMQVPRDEKPAAPQQIEVAWLDKSGDGKTLTLTSGASASAPSIAATPLPGEVLVGYVSEQRAYVVRLRCDA
jgi:hypothetical protein